MARDPRPGLRTEEAGGPRPRIRARANELIDDFIDSGEVDAYTEFKNVIVGGGDPSLVRDSAEREAAFTDCEDWFAAEFDRREESGNLGEDIIGWLFQIEVDGRPITRDEMHGICNRLMIAGLDTVAVSLSCILANLARNPERR